jgi:hypothetical protein
VATYQVVPYLISVKPRGSHGGEIRPLDDLDGKKTKLIDLLKFTLSGAVGKGPFAFARNNDTTHRIASTEQNDRTIFVLVTQGSKGIESKIGTSNTVVFNRTPNHIEDIDFRNVIIFPKHGKYAVLLTERIGNRGVAGFLGKLITETMRENFSEVTTSMKALTSVADLKTTDLLLRSLDFKFPASNDPSGKRIDMTKADGYFSIKWRFMQPRRLSNYTDGSGKKLDASRIFGVMDQGLVASGLDVSGERLKELGVEADLHVTLPSGNQRTFTMGSDEGPGLAYKLEPQVPQAGSGVSQTAVGLIRPTDDDFLRVCKEAVSDVAGNFGVTAASAKYCEIPDPSVSVVTPDNWKVVWNVPDHIAPGSA